MREFKFRAWDKRNEVMGQVSRIDFNEAQYPFAAVRFKQHGRTRDEGYHFGQEDGSDNIILLQYTGLKDQNGKEIYEGDILKVTDGADELTDSSDTGIGVVEWLERYGFWNVSKLENGLGDLNVYGYLEVIGNIYENPELLENIELLEVIEMQEIICPDCGAKLIFQSGCVLCHNCGWSMCG